MSTQVISEEDSFSLRGRKTRYPVTSVPTSPSIISWIRRIGAFLIVGSIAIFLLARWDGALPIHRLWAFEAFIAFAGLAGLFCTFVLYEPKGGRTLLALGTTMISGASAIAGGILFDQYQEYPFGMNPEQGGLPSLSLLGLCALATPLVVATFGALFKARALLFAGSFIAFNAMLLIPHREERFTIIALLPMIALLTYLASSMRNIPGGRTIEGRIALLLVASPAVIFCGRYLFFGQYSAAISVLSLTACGLAFLFPVREMYSSERFTYLCELTALFLFSSAWYQLGDTSLVVRLGGACAIGLIGTYTIQSRGIFLSVAAVLAECTAFFALSTSTSILDSFLIIGVGASVVYAGILERSSYLKVLGGALIIIKLIDCVHDTLQGGSVDGWGLLIVVGVLLVIGASLLERNRR
jgi:hypothetical protein